MNFQIKSNVSLTEGLEGHVLDKIQGKLEPFEGYLKEVVVKLDIENKSHIVKVLFKLKGQGRVNSITEKTEDLYKSIDKVADKVVRKVSQHKNKLDKKATRHEVESMEEILPSADFPVTHGADESEYEIAKIKQFLIKPMFIEDAIEQMNMLGHNFFFYTDADTNRPSVVYKRKNNTYGVIESGGQ